MTIDKNTLDLAREWRKDIDRGAENFSQDYIDAAAEVIQALPEVIVDGDKLREVMAEMAYSLEQTVADNEDRAHDVATARWRDRLEGLLPTPAPRTLADMSPEEREACQWMQGDVDCEPEPVPIIKIWEGRRAAEYLKKGGGTGHRIFKLVTPRPDLPTMKWPSATPTEQATPTQHNPSSDRSTDREPKDSDVPAGDAWLVEFEGSQCYGVRDWAGSPEWTVVDSDGDRRYAEDEEIQRITRLVSTTEPRVLSTVEDYENAAVLTVVKDTAEDFSSALTKYDENEWRFAAGTRIEDSYMARVPRTVLWEPQS